MTTLAGTDRTSRIGAPVYYTPPEQDTRRPAQPRTAALTAEDKYGIAIVRQILSDVFGGALDNFAEKAWRDYNSGKPMEQIVFELRQTKEHAARFPGMKGLTEAGQPIDERTYIELERRYIEVARGFDLPPSFYDQPEDLGRFIERQMSPAEFQRRLTVRQIAERESRDPVAAAEIRRQYADAGLGEPSDGDFLAAFIDPARGISAIEQRLEAARVATAARRAGYGALTLQQSRGLADMGIDYEQATRGFEALSESGELFSALPGETGDVFSRDEQIGAAFGTDAAARRRIERQRRQRLSEFGGGGGVASGRGGLTALGSG